MTGWQGIALALALGWAASSWRHFDKVEHLRRIIIALKAAQEHEPCMEIIGRLWAECEALKGQVDHLENADSSAADAADELARDVEGYLRGQP